MKTHIPSAILVSWLFLSTLLVQASYSAQREEPEIKVQNTFSDDSRMDADSNLFPARAVGKLISPSGSYCTATLVSQDLILTAAHCIMSNGALVTGNYVFQVGLNAGKAAGSSGTSQAWWGTADPDHDRQNDWALMRLTQSLGLTYGWLGVTGIDLNQELGQQNFELIAYSLDWRGGNTPSDEPHCQFSGAQEGFFLHNCDTTPGASGGAMFFTDKTRTPHIVAINVAEFSPAGAPLKGVPYSAATANIAVSAQKFLPTLRSILNLP